ncbi:T9SS type A sorting domain-containing protein [Hymenobacter armeniacus]|uniref:T9SS type A sorting domain-containing protein n=1 Tax=Hymenobacter armeniacus TaxID=2771358 RepID=A0ABR8JQG6_9BACT|nr:T9SS type A sorting domain-containing protein [Hymenobacter armeniacus]MBD2720835.1 T9SS type A sorting domain-containing protein [Hymenobacter armeniacus]
MRHTSFLPALGQLPCWGTLLLLLLAGPARAQFPTTATATLFLCNAPGNQFGVQAVADGAGGSFVLWIDKRNGNNSGPGTGIYAQHLDAAGLPQLATNGQLLFQSRGRDIVGMKSVAWRGGLLVAWVQGAFGAGGDTVRCQYYNALGVPQWAAPALVAAAAPPAIAAESENALNIMPNDSGAIITHALRLNGGSARFAFNRVSATGQRRWPLNYQQVNVNPLGGVPADFYHTIGDGGNGFYLVAGAGGTGSAIFAQHYTLQGIPWGAFTTISAGGALVSHSGLRLARDPANNLYVAWSNSGGDVLVAKILPGGAWGWAGPGYITASPSRFAQELADALWYDNALWLIWNDARGGASTGLPNLQTVTKMDAAGTMPWGTREINQQADYSISPKLAGSDNGAVMAFYASGTLRGFGAQKLLTNGAMVFSSDGVVLHTTGMDWPSTFDYVPVSQPNGSVQVFWATSALSPTGQDICAVRVQNSGTLLRAARAAESLGFDVFPNPATDGVQAHFPAGKLPTALRLFDAQGRLVRAFPDAAALSVRGLPAGLYVLRATLAGQGVSRRVLVE